MRASPLRIFVAAAACVLLAGCAAPPRQVVRGEIAGQPVASSLDSAIARHYLEKYLQGRREDAALDARIEALHRRFDRPVPTREDLVSVARESSLDFAALFLAQRLLEDACNREVNRAFVRHLSRESATPLDTSRYQVLFVPGWDYRKNGHLTGADFSRPRALAASLGIQQQLVPLEPNGAIEPNARILAAEIARATSNGRRIILASASSGGPATHLALAELIGPGERAAVAAWVNIGGILQGSPFVEQFQSGPRSLVLEIGLAVTGMDRDAVLSLGTTPGRTRFQRLRLDPAILVVNYLGLGLSGRISRYSRSTYPALAPEGPNDGFTLLADAIAPGSLTVLAPGSDHFFSEDPRIDEKTVALMKLVIELAERGSSGRCQPRR